MSKMNIILTSLATVVLLLRPLSSIGNAWAFCILIAGVVLIEMIRETNARY